MKQVVLITGASSGIGKVMAKHLADQGFLVYGAARRVEKMRDLEALGIRLLVAGGRKPSEVYLDVGFENFSHFSYSFKKVYGRPPSAVSGGG